ncbi:hypothetical protein ACRRTK_004305 [Alexandromys fortis]
MQDPVCTELGLELGLHTKLNKLSSSRATSSTQQKPTFSPKQTQMNRPLTHGLRNEGLPCE